MDRAVIGLFEDFNEAQSVVQDLERTGFSRDDINMVRYEQTGKPAETAGARPGFLDRLKAIFGFSPPSEEIESYAEGVRRGGTLVVVRADGQADRAVDVLSRHGAVDIDQRSIEWRKSGWSGVPAVQTQVMPVVEEELHVGKREVQRGGVRVYSHVTERPVEEKVQLREERVTVERRPADRPLTEAEAGAAPGAGVFKEQTIEMRETAEEPVVAKHARVVEEVVVGRAVAQRTETVRETLRRIDVDVERVPGGGTIAGFETLRPDLEKHFQATYAPGGMTFEQYQPAYRYGCDLAASQRFGGRDWTEIEPKIRDRWEERNPGTWDRVKDAVRFAREQAIGR